jgi:hypothetical protein
MGTSGLPRDSLENTPWRPTSGRALACGSSHAHTAVGIPHGACISSFICMDLTRAINTLPFKYGNEHVLLPPISRPSP